MTVLGFVLLCLVSILLLFSCIYLQRVAICLERARIPMRLDRTVLELGGKIEIREIEKRVIFASLERTSCGKHHLCIFHWLVQCKSLDLFSRYIHLYAIIGL
ncbi:hypothetical protein F4678DRAFT_95839 [Xylaria arbuscula]|nr:hypothetical protein F4678DRAFT_95839 [Xylaria arbuscula]